MSFILALLIIGYILIEIIKDIVDATARPSTETLRQSAWIIFQTIARIVVLFAASVLLGRSP